MIEFPQTFEDTLYENKLRTQLGLLDERSPQELVRLLPLPEQVSTFVSVEPGIGLGNETYRRGVGRAPVAQSFAL